MTAIREMTAADWPQVEAILAAGIAGGEATFETTTPTWEAFDAGKIREGRLVALDGDGTVIGWVAASPVSARAVYRGVIEHSVYVDPARQGRGVGRALLAAFIDAVEDAGYWTIQSSIFPENTASLRLHEQLGFRVVGTRERIARSELGPHAGQWRDTVLVERRSARNGSTRPTVLFVCVHNAGRSQMAAGYLAALAGDRVDVRSAGSAPKDQINPVAIEVMREEGIDLTGNAPKLLTVDAVKTADVVITMGCGDACPIFPGKRYEDWELDDPAGQDAATVRRIRDDIRARVEALMGELLPG